MSTFLQLKNKLATQVGDPNVDTTVTGDALNYTEQQFFNDFDLTLNNDTQTNTLSAGATTLTTALPSNLQKIRTLYITSPVAYANDLKDYFVPVDQFRKSFTAQQQLAAGTPTHWTFYTGVEFANPSDQTYTIKVDYTKSVPLMTNDSDTPTIPEPFEELLILGAKIRIYEQKEDFDYAQQFNNRYQDLRESFLKRYSNRQVDTQARNFGSRFRPTRVS